MNSGKNSCRNIQRQSRPRTVWFHLGLGRYVFFKAWKLHEQHKPSLDERVWLACVSVSSLEKQEPPASDSSTISLADVLHAVQQQLQKTLNSPNVAGSLLRHERPITCLFSGPLEDHSKTVRIHVPDFISLPPRKASSYGNKSGFLFHLIKKKNSLYPARTVQ